VLKQRLMTAAILVPIVIGSILYLPYPYFAFLLALFVAQGSWEWTTLAQIKSPLGRVSYVVLIAALLYGAWLSLHMPSPWVFYMLIAAVLWWLFAFFLVMLYPKYTQLRTNKMVTLLAGVLILVPSWVALIRLHARDEQGPMYVMFLLVIIWVADSGAYFGGRKWGKNKLAPNVSPKKTWEGVAVGLIGVAVLSVAGAIMFGYQHEAWGNVAVFVTICVITVLFSVLGDLTESLFKRQSGVKDSGTLLPGHGGVLDRIDSITAAAPVFLICLWLFLGFELDFKTSAKSVDPTLLIEPPSQHDSSSLPGESTK